MGCCISDNGTINDIPFELIEEFNKLKLEINQILKNKNNIDQKNNKILLDIINNNSIKIAKCEEVIENLKSKKKNNPKIITEVIEGIKENIKELKEYNTNLNEQVKKNKSILQLSDNKHEVAEPPPVFIQEEINTDKGSSDSRLKGKNDLINKDVVPIYFKKNIKRNKRFNNISNNFSKSNSHCLTYYNYNNKKNISLGISAYNSNKITLYDEKNKINIIFVLENGKKRSVRVDIKDTFLHALNKLGEKETEYNNIDNIIVLDGNNDITNRVKDEENICDFGFNDYHFIQLKLLANANTNLI
jgi:hypothetical protein